MQEHSTKRMRAALVVLLLAECMALDNGLGLTPPMGVSTWNYFQSHVNETLVRELADAMVDEGLRDAGWRYLNIDDGWACNRTASPDEEIVPCKLKFPSGMKALADYVHSKGLLFGLYSTWGSSTCAHRGPGEGPGEYVGSFDHEEIDARTFAYWGVDYLKVDSCGGPEIGSLWSRYAKFRDALNATGRPIYYSITEQVFNQHARDPPAAAANETFASPHPSMQCFNGSFTPLAWRHQGRDVATLANSWLVEYCNNGPSFGKTLGSGGSLLSQLDAQQDLTLPELAGPGGWNDMDLMQVCNPGMSTIESRAEMSLWSVLASPLILGNDIRHMSADCKAIVLNQEVLAVSQDVFASPGYLVWSSSSILQDNLRQIFMRPLTGKLTFAVVMFNRGSEPQNITLEWHMLQPPVSGACSVRDLWAHKSLGNSTGNFTVEVGAHAATMLKLACY